MSWSIGYDENWKRDIGYGVPAICDQPGCGAAIDRGLSYVCGGQPYGGERGCGLYFCDAHLQYSGRKPVQLCDRCVRSGEPYAPTPDTEEWNRHKATDESWHQWRVDQCLCEDEGCPQYGTLHKCVPK
jgi:hypothetical protein